MNTLEAITSLFTGIVSDVTKAKDFTLDLRASYGGYLAVVTEALTWEEVTQIAWKMADCGLSLRMHGGSVDCVVTFEDGDTAFGYSWVFDVREKTA